MPPRKSNVSANGVDEGGTETTPAKTTKEREGLSVDDLSLPKSMVARLAKGVLPANTQIQKDALLALHKSATVFVSYIASNSSENAQNAGKKTIMPQDVMAALKDAEFDEFIPRLEAELKKYNDAQSEKRNSYRRKVKEDKATTGPQDGAESTENSTLQNEGDAAEVSVVVTNGHTNGNSTLEDGERPVKKLKAENGDAVMPDADDADDDETNGEVDANSEDEDQDAEEEEEGEEEDDGEDEEEEGEEEGDEEDGPDSNSAAVPDVYFHDETLDESDSD